MALNDGGDMEGVLWSPTDGVKVPIDVFAGSTGAEKANFKSLLEGESPGIRSNTGTVVNVGADPLLITGISSLPPNLEDAASWPPGGETDSPVCVSFPLYGNVEEGIYVAKFQSWRKAHPGRTLQNKVPALQLDDENAFIYGDVDDNYIFFANGKLKIEMIVTASAREKGKKAGFNVMYDSPRGYVFSPWQVVSVGTGWRDYVISLNDANFANKGGFDFRLSALGSEQDIFVSKICVKRIR